MVSPSPEQFLKDVSNHEMEILKDDGVYRHVRFGRPGDSCMSFRLVTFPGHLVYAGDMGTYVFWRLEDMFQFFGTKGPEPTDLSRIDMHYWHQKLTAVDASDGSQQSSSDAFREALCSYETDDLTDSEQDEVTEEIERLTSLYEDDNHAAINEASEFEIFRDGERVFDFSDLWDHNFMEYTHRFVWACYAIRWGVDRYLRTKGMTCDSGE